MSQGPETTAFQRVLVDFKVPGQTRVTWTHSRHFHAPAPWTYQLQWGWTANPNADDWAAGGTPAPNVSQLVDPDPRSLGKLSVVHYRVKLADGSGVIYYSSPSTVEGQLDKREWLMAQEMFRRENLINVKKVGIEGYLLKAKRHGPLCTLCLDPRTGEPTRSKCPVCRGTRFQSGYYRAISGTYSQLEQSPSREHRDLQQHRGTVYDEVPRGRFIGFPQLYAYDVWVDRDSDQRFYLHEISVKGHWRGVPIVYEAELRLAAIDDVIYTVPLEGTP